MTDVQPIPVYRPTFLTDAGEFRGSLIESPANIFYQNVSASRATKNRLQFQWRSVSDNLLLSPTVMLRMRLRITCPQIWDQLTSALSVHGASFNVGADADVDVYKTAATGTTAAQGKVPCLVFADGDAFSNVCSSANLIFNGTSISLNRQNRFWRDWMRTQVACEDAARIYKSCGGSYDRYDQTPVSVSSAPAGTLATVAVGVTQDSGISERSKNLYAMSTTGQIIGDFAREIQVSYPVPLPPFNPWRGHSLPASCPYKSCPLAIPHLSSGSLDFLLEDFDKAFLRRLGDVQAGAGTRVADNKVKTAVGIEIVDGATYVELKYFRLSHSRSLKESYRFAIWQAQTFLGEAPPTGPAPDKGFEKFGDVVAMTPIGKDHITKRAACLSQISSTQEGKTWKIQFDTLNLAQIPSFLLISCPKLTDSYTMNSEFTVGNENAEGNIPNCVRNLSRNLNIKQIRIIVNSARGAIEKSADVDTGFIDAERLWQMTRENCNSKYFAEGGFRAWRDFGCALLLSSPQFAPGLQACDGVAYPVQIQIEMEVQNRAVDVCALSLHGSAVLAGGNDTPMARYAQTGGNAVKTCHMLQPDFIRAQAQCTAFYQKVVLATTETSASVNAMNYPLASAERLLNAAGSRF
jgi:hypothetical protein